MPRISSRRAAIAGIGGLAATGLLAAGCGSSDDSTASTTAESTTSSAAAPPGGGSSETVKISETEFELTPADVTVKAGTVTFDVANDGSTVHSLEVEGPSGEQEIEGDLEPGASGELTVDLSEPGTYEMYCPVDGHKDMGMTGEITVEG